MFRRWAVLLAVVVGGLVIGAPSAAAHAALRSSDPAPGSALDTAPTQVTLTFSEEPEPTLSTVEVTSTSGASFQQGLPARGADPFSLVSGVGPLEQGTYVVRWHVVSATDGHPTSGAFAFGVGVLPDEIVTASSDSTTTSLSALELVGRWSFIAGVGLLLGVGAASAFGFGRADGPGRLGAAAWLTAAFGLVGLAEAQRRGADASLTDLLHTSVGRALEWRALALGAAAVALGVARSRYVRTAMLACALACAGALAAHVEAGHAASARSWQWAVFSFQWLHLVAIGVWAGGLVVLLLDLRGAPSPAKGIAVRRFSRVALAALLLVVVTGVARALGEVADLDELTASGYGRTILVKSGLVVVILVLAASNRWRNTRVASTNLQPLRRAGRAEIGVAAGALVAGALLAGLSPPAAARVTPPSGLSASGSDAATTVTAELSTASPLPGPNRFTLHLADHDSGAAVIALRVNLHFSALDDADEPATNLGLDRIADGTYSALGENLAFDGRWRVDAEIEQPHATTVVPFLLETHRPPQFVSVTRIPGEPAFYSVQIADETLVNFAFDPERVGASTITVSFADIISDERPIDRLLLTTDASGQVAQHSARRISTGRFAVDVVLPNGRTRVTAIAHTPDGTRLWAQFELSVS